ncbi:hypothetical protein RclHR1_23720003 [Rhizophagus clarus]|uniref:Uncharacterized protein n=1 Tax=Rhizophagus clarus TaxID=94130 RepID=A0A2Z6RA10_9GLOM|nr:hypothetical protein RclHR1_23720003 [Rhizophagus clarus]
MKENKQRVIIDTYKNEQCTKCKVDCNRQHPSLKIEYKELRQVIRNFNSYREPHRCYNHQEETYHIPFRYPKNICNKCGKKDHARQMCNTMLYFWNRLHHCGYNLKTVKRNKSTMNNNGGNYCYTYLKPVKYKDAYSNQSLRKLKCKSYFENKRPLTPKSEDDRKRTRIEIPEDPLENMVLNPKPQSKGKNKILKVKCLECEREERTMNPINELGICQKCENKKIALERYGSKTTIRQCCVCGKHTDSYNSRAGGEIVCDQECNDIMTIVYRARKDKSGKIIQSDN